MEAIDTTEPFEQLTMEEASARTTFEPVADDDCLGALRILNVGYGDYEIRFGKEDADDKMTTSKAERAARVIEDLLKKGAVILAETTPGSGAFKRVRKFNKKKMVYVVEGEGNGETVEQPVATTRAAAVSRSAGGCMRTATARALVLP